jgi:succinate dehydrogenase / fumarate reductase cytochrome b subunit
MENTAARILTSSLGKKYAMGITGLFLISFLIVHCGINALIFYNDGGEIFNLASHFMGTNIIIRTMEVVLFIGIIWHIVQSLILTIDNNKARPVKYDEYNGKANSKWYSRWMGLLGTLILIFLVIHLKHFWFETRFTHVDQPPMMIDGKEYENLYAEMIAVFQNPLVVLVYVLGNISLAYHLMHGFQSAFQSLGLSHKTYTPLIKMIGVGFSIFIPFIFIMMPVSIYAGWVK